MAVVQAYFDGVSNFDNIKKYRIAIETSLINKWKSYLFPKDIDDSRILYAPNENCFRKRLEQTQSNVLKMPFLNYKLKTFQFDNTLNWRQYIAYTNGIYISEIGANVKIMPIILDYEATYWCNRDDELRYVSTLHSFQNGSTGNRTNYNVTINDNDLELFSLIEYTDNGIDNEYTEKDWLEANKIHSLGLSCSLRGNVFLVDSDVTITEQCILQFTNIHEVDEEYSSNEEFIVNP